MVAARVLPDSAAPTADSLVAYVVVQLAVLGSVQRVAAYWARGSVGLDLLEAV